MYSTLECHLRLMFVNFKIFSEHFKKVISRANLEPVKKYTHPQTEAQEVGWITRPLVRDKLLFPMYTRNLQQQTLRKSGKSLQIKVFLNQ